MNRLRAYKTKLILNHKEESYLLGCVGFSRFVYNWGLAEWNRQYEVGWRDAAQYKGDYLLEKHGDTEDIRRLRFALSDTAAAAGPWLRLVRAAIKW